MDSVGAASEEISDETQLGFSVVDKGPVPRHTSKKGHER